MPQPTTSPYLFQFGVFELDLRSHELRRQGTRIRLPKQQFQVLSLLVQRAGEAVTRDELKNRLWDATVFVDQEEGLNKAIEKTRDTLGDSPKNSRFIETLSGLGYRFIARVEPIIDRPPAPPPAPDPIPVVVGPGPIGSLAVLPFRDSSPDPGQEYFADGMTEVLTTNLAQIRALRVISRTSTIQYKQGCKTMPEIARELNVEGVVEGSVSRSQGHVRVTANLIHAPTDKHLWGNHYRRELRDVLVLQSEVALEIATEVRIKITPSEIERLTNPREVKPEAFDAYALGRHFWNQRTEYAFNKGIDCFRQSIQEDPDYAEAHAGLADCYTMLAWNSMRPPKDALPKAKAAAQTAIKLDDQLAEAHSSLAVTLMFHDWDWAGAEREFRRSIELNPNYGVARPWYAFELSALGRDVDACAESRRALRIDPVSLPIGVSSGLVFYLARQYDRALEIGRKIVDMEPTRFYQSHFMVGTAYERKGMFNEALLAFERAVTISNGNAHMLAAKGHALARAGQTAEAHKVIDELKERSAKGYISPYNIAMVYAGLGEKAETLDWLEKACDDRSMWMIFVNAYPIFDDLRADPRFQGLVHRMGFTV